MKEHLRAGRFVALVIAAITVASAWLTAVKLRISSDMSTLLPDSGAAEALGRWTRAFGGRDPALVLVRGECADDVAQVAQSIAEQLRRSSSVVRVIDRAPVPTPSDPTLAWALAGPLARARLAAILTPDGMRERLAETRSLLLAPAAGDAERDFISRDPLRLSQVPWEAKTELSGGVTAFAGARFVTDDGRARLVVCEPRGSAFVSEDARALVRDVDVAMARAALPGVTTELAGGLAIARATEQMLKRDMAVSGSLSLALASLAFVVTFRRVRALVAVLPPLLIGTLWTTGLAALLPGGLSAVAIAFAAVVVGVGVDTGVHVYAALLDARRAGFVGSEAARAARRATWRPTLTAAAIAAAAFAALALSGLRAMKELGLLCGAGELLTAVAILIMTPAMGARLERRTPPPAIRSAFIESLGRFTSSRRGAALALALCAAPLGVVAVVGWPRPADALVAIRPRALAPLVAEQHIRALFGGSPGQWVVLTIDTSDDRARARADRLAEALESLQKAGSISGFDSLATFAPSVALQRSRLAERDKLDLPSRGAALRSALAEAGFQVEAFRPALAAWASPAHDLAPEGGLGDDAAAFLFARHIAHDHGETLVATYVRRNPDPRATAAARAGILAADPGAIITSFDAIDSALRDVMRRDLLLVGAAALVVVALAMRAALKSARYALVALATLVCEIGALGLTMRIFAFKWHIYDALVVPVLFGITIDESMFLLDAVRQRSVVYALGTQGPLVSATALTTAAGFAALVACRFDGLRDLGAVGAIGVLAGLGASLVIVPATLRVLEPRSR